MKTRIGQIFIVCIMLAAAFLPQGCTSHAQPSDEDIVQAIDASGIMKRPDGSITIVPPVVIAQKGKQNNDGSWPVKVTFTLIYKLKNGRNSPPAATTTSFRIYRAKDGTGVSTWEAQPGS